MTRIIIVVSGGVVQYVLADQDAKIVLVDYDLVDEDGSLEKKYDDYLSESHMKMPRQRIQILR